MPSPLSAFHPDRHFAVVEDLELGDLHAHAEHAGQLHQSARELADQALQQVHVLGRAFVDDDLAHLPVVQHVADVVVVRQQGLAALVEFGVHLDGLGRGLLMVEDAQVGIEAQSGEREDLQAAVVVHGHDGCGRKKGKEKAERERSARAGVT